MDMACFKTSTGESTRETGKTISNTAMVKRYGTMVLRPMKGSSLMVKRMARDGSCGWTAHSLREIS